MAASVTSVESLCNLLKTSRLMSDGHVRSVYKHWRSRVPRGTPGEVERFGRWLAAEHHLTAYQAQQLLVGRTGHFILNHYKLLDLVGKGRMAGIFKAAHVSGHLVAIKIMPSFLSRDTQALARFRREARMGVRLKHDNIVRTFHLGQHGGRHYLVMEYLEGETLEETLKRRRRLPFGEAARLMHQTLLGMQHIHQEGMIHRDLKPGNLMLVPVRPPGAPDNTLHATVKILDIGMGRLLVDEATVGGHEPNTLTTDGMMLGTPDYMSPEQARSAHTVDIRADIYSLGCVLYHLLTGGPPFPDKSPVMQIVRHAQEMPRPVRESDPTIPTGLQTVLDGMMAKDPRQRFATPIDAARLLQGFFGPQRQQLPETHTLGEFYLKWVDTQPLEEVSAAPAVPDRWLFRHLGKQCGPVTSAQLDSLAISGQLAPDDLLWMEGDDPAFGIHARAAIDFPSLARPARSPTQHKLAAHATTAQPADPGFDPATGRILDPERFKQWQRAQKQKRDEEVSRQPTIQEVFFKARNDMSSWADLEKNRPLILTGDMEAVRKDPGMQRFMQVHQVYGDEMLHKLWQHLEFMIENRRKYFYALSR